MTKEERNDAIKVLKNFDLNNPKVNSLLFSAEEITNAFAMAINELEQESCEDAISREVVIERVKEIAEYHTGSAFNADRVITHIKLVPPVTPEKTTITYKDCSEAMLKMWIDNVLTDGQYNKIMDKLNAKHIEDMRGVSGCSEENKN